MKKTKRILAVSVAFALVLSFASPIASALETNPAENAGMEAADMQTAQYASKISTGVSDTASRTAVPDPVFPADDEYVKNELLVKYIDGGAQLADGDSFLGVSVSGVEDLFSVPVTATEAAENGTQLQESGAEAQWARLDFADGSDLTAKWKALQGCEGVLAVQPNYVYSTASSSTADISAYDPLAHSQTWLDLMDAPAGWDLVTAQGKVPGGGVTVAVVDSGVDMDHPDLKDNLLTTGYDYVDKDSIPDDESGHGTHVAGIIAAGKNALGVRGVAYGAKILPVRVLDKNGRGSSDNISAGIKYAADNNASLINLSIGGFGYDKVEADAISYARKKGSLVFAAAGNESVPTTNAGDNYYGPYSDPANNCDVFTVMAMDNRAASNGDWLASFSNYDADPGTGSEYQVMAPGVDIMSTYMDGGYGKMSGTSMATPATVGAAAVLKGLGFTNDQIWEALATSGDEKQGKTQPDGKNVRSYHTLDLAKAIGAESATLEPNIENCSVSAFLERVTTVDGSTVNLGNLNTSSLVYFKDGKFLSGLNLYVENLGGHCGAVTVSGTAGNATVSGSVASLAPGQSATIPLTITGTPAITDTANNAVPVSLTVTYGSSKTTEVTDSFTAFDFSLPAGITYNTSGYYLTSNTVTVPDGYHILCLGKPLNIYNGQTLNYTGGIVYENTSASINVASGGTAIFRGASLMGSGLFNATATYNANNVYLGLFLYWCYVYDPNISQASELFNDRVYSNSAKSSVLNSHFIEACGIYDLPSATITGDFFAYNLVNRCTDCKLYAQYFARYNTFAENGKYFSGNSLGALTAYVPNYQAGNYGYDMGFYNNCIIGPMSIYDYSNQSNMASKGNCYYQSVQDINSETKTLPSGTADTLECSATDIELITDTTKASFVSQCPAFVTREDWTCNLDSTLSYTAKYTLSTPVASAPSVTDAFDGFHCEAVLSEDAKCCTVKGTTNISDYTMTVYPLLRGLQTKDYTTVSGSNTNTVYFSATSGLREYTFLKFDLSAYKYYGLTLTWSNESKPVLNWKLPTGSNATIKRVTNDDYAAGKITTLTTNSEATGTYTDNDVAAGNKYTYQLYVGSNTVPYRSVDAFVAGTDNTLQYTLNTTDNTITVSTKNAAEIKNGAQFDVNYSAAAYGLPSIDFSDVVKKSGCAYGAYISQPGKLTVMVGQSGDDFYIPANTAIATIHLGPVANAVGGPITVTNAKNGSGGTAFSTPTNCIEVSDYIAGTMTQTGYDTLSAAPLPCVAVYNTAGKLLGTVLCSSPTDGARLTDLKTKYSAQNPAKAKIIYMDRSTNKPVADPDEIDLTNIS